MKKILIMLCAFSFLITAQPRTSQASLAKWWAFTPVGVVFAITGVVTTIVGGVYLITGAMDRDRSDMLLGGVLMGIGLVILDEEGNTAVKFKPISEQLASEKNITSEERDDYQKDLNRLNAVVQSITERTRRYSEESGDISEQAQVKYASTLWEQTKENFRPGTISALKKIGAAFEQQNQVAE